MRVLTRKIILFALCSPLFFAEVFFPVPSLAKDITVPESYKTIQAAVDAAEPGDVINIGDGRYKENVRIKKRLVLKSRNGHRNTVLEPLSSAEAVIKIDSTIGVVISELTVEGVEEGGATGIHVIRCSGCTIIGNHVKKNYTGILLEQSSNSTVSNNVVSENTDGISLYFSDNNKVEDNKVDSNLEKGILFLSSNENTLARNSTNSNYWNGITLMTSHRNLIKQNVSLQNTYAMVITDSENNEFSGNRTMRRLYYALPVVLVYLGLLIYHIEKKIFVAFFAEKGEVWRK